MSIIDFVAIDIESTGLDHEKDEVIEVALVRFQNGVAVDRYQTLVKPGQEVRAFIHSLTGISAEDLNTAPVFADVANSIRTFIGSSPLVAHNAQFDSRFLKQAYTKMGQVFEVNSAFDTLLLSRVIWQEVSNHRLETLIASLGIERAASHRALPDAQACGELFVLSIQKYQDFSASIRYELARLAKGTVWESLFASMAPNESVPFAMQSAQPNAPKLSPQGKVPNRVHDYFAPNGALSRTVPGYVANEQQQNYAEIVERNLFMGGLAVLEAGTGTGKSLGYLVPAVIKAAVNGERVVISTATRALQEQLLQKDIPLLEPILGGKLKAAIVKGRNNYLCLRKFHEHLDHAELLLPVEEREAMMPLIPWVERTTTGDANESGGFHIGRNRQLWAKLASESSTCVGQTCAYFQQCFGLGARRKATEANLVLVNHALFLQDLATDFALLPTYEHIVFDEAHRLPQAAHEVFGKRIWFFRYRNQVKILVHVRNPKHGLLAEVETWLNSQLGVEAALSLLQLSDKIRQGVQEAEKQLHRFFLRIGKNLKRFADRDGLRYSQPLAIEADADPKPALNELDSLLESLRKLIDKLADVQGSAAFQRDLDGSRKELESFRRDLEFVTHSSNEEWAFWMEEPGNPHTLVLWAQPIEPGKQFASKFYPWIKSALFTSATMSVQGGLEYYMERMGMHLIESDSPKRPFARILDLPFDIDARRQILIADFLPKPNDKAFQAAMDEVLCAILPEIPVSSMVLFTALSALGKSHNALAPLFAARSRNLLSQHTDGAIDNLVELFRKSKGSCLIGAQMLWEGIDLPGDSLEFLVIPKLPFPTPGDALIQARGDLARARGGNSFKDVFIPEAVLALRQGMGRLIRGKEDQGIVLLLDPRLIHENYGKSFTRMWGGRHTVVHSLEELKNILEVQ